MQRHEANWKLLRRPVPIPCPSPARAEGCPSAQTMVEEAALAAFPFCSLGSRGSTQARARFSSWIHMKRLCADCSLPSCSASCHGSGSRAHTGNRKAESICSRQSREHNAGKTKSEAVCAAFPVAFASRAWSRFPLFMSLLTCRSLSSADRPQSPAAGSLCLFRSNRRNALNTEPEPCVCIEALSSLALAPGVPICFPTPEDSNGAL